MLLMKRVCVSCKTKFEGRKDAKTCSVRCRKRLQRLNTSLQNVTQNVNETVKVAEQKLEDTFVELKQDLLIPQEQTGFIEISSDISDNNHLGAYQLPKSSKVKKDLSKIKSDLKRDQLITSNKKHREVTAGLGFKRYAGLIAAILVIAVISVFWLGQKTKNNLASLQAQQDTAYSQAAATQLQLDKLSGEVDKLNLLTDNGQGIDSGIDASALTAGTLDVKRLSSSVTIQGNSINIAGGLVQLNALGALPVLSGANLTDLNANNISSGTISTARLNSLVTIQGNTFNGASGLVQLSSSGFLPALNGSALTSLTSANLTGALPAISGAALTSLSAANLTGTLPALNGAALTSLTAGNLSGALPAISGAALTSLTAGNLSGALPAISGANLTSVNASSLGGATFAAPGPIGSTTSSSGAFTTISATGQITSTLAAGTAPFVIASTDNVANLNASLLGGATFAAPGAIGSGTAGTGAFTTLTSGAQTITSSSANALAVGSNGTTNPALNIDASTASSTTGLNIKSAANGGGLALTTTSGTTNDALTLSAKGSGTLTLASGSTGDVQFFSSSNKITSAGALTVAGAIVGVGVNAGAGLLQGALGLTVTGAAVSVNASSNFATNINTGTSNTLVSIGGGSGTFALDTTNIDISSAGAITGATGVSTTTLTSTSTSNIGSGTGVVTLNSSGALGLTAASASTWTLGANALTLTSSNINVSSAGVLTLAGAQTVDVVTASAGTSSAVTIAPGDSTTNSGTGSSLTLRGSNQTGTTSVGGNLVLQGGSGTTTNGTVQIDSNATVAAAKTLTLNTHASTPAILVLGIRTNSGESTDGGATAITNGATDGAMYYNSADHRFRCYRDSAWFDCFGIPRPGSKRVVYIQSAGGGTTLNGYGDSMGTASCSTVSGGGSTAVNPTGTEPGYYQLTTDNVTGTKCSNGSKGGNSGNVAIYRAGKNMLYQTAAKIDSTSSVRVFITMGSTSGSAAGSYNTNNPAYNMIGFRYDTGTSNSSTGTDTNWMCILKDGSTMNATSSGVAPQANTLTKFEVQQIGNNYIFRINGIVVCNQTNNRPADGTLLTMNFAITPNENVSHVLSVVYFYEEEDY